MVPEHQDRAGIVDLGVFPDELLEEDRRHRRDVFMAEPDVGEHEPFVARLHGWNADLPFRRIDDPTACQDLLAQRHRALRRLGRMQHDFTLEPGHVVVEQPAMLDDAAGDLALARGEHRQRDDLPAAHLVENREIGRRQHAEVLTVLAVDALDAFGYDQSDPGAHLGVRRLLPGRTLPAPLAADRRHEAPALHRTTRDGEFVAALEPEVGEFAERFVVVVANVGGSDFVGRDIVAELVLRRPGRVIPGELRTHEARILGEVEDPALQSNVCVTHVRSIFLGAHVCNRIARASSDIP